MSYVELLDIKHVLKVEHMACLLSIESKSSREGLLYITKFEE